MQALSHVARLDKFSLGMPDASNTRRWLQFRLRTLLIGLTIVAAILGVVVERVSKQRRAVAAVMQAGGTVMYDWHESAPRTMSTAGRPAGPAWLRRWIGDDYFQRPVLISLFGGARDDSWVQAIADLPSIKYLFLGYRGASDDLFARLPSLPNLEELHIEGGPITDEGMKHIGKFPRLRWLIASGTKITDEGLRDLATLQLEELSLRETSISDVGVPVLATMKHLHKLDLRGSTVTEAGVSRLRSALPNCEILR